jgi:hypothetical protein
VAADKDDDDGCRSPPLDGGLDFALGAAEMFIWPAAGGA